MLLGRVSVPTPVLEQHFAAGVQELLGGTDMLYTQLTAETARMTGSIKDPMKKVTVGLMPVAYFGMRTAVQALRDPEVAPLLPADVGRRGSVLRQCSDLMIIEALRRGDLRRLYSDTPQLAPLINNPNQLMATALRGISKEGESIKKLGGAAIVDVTMVAGGALRLLQHEHPSALEETSAAAIVGDSAGLQLIARVPDDALESVRRHLGSPYTHRKYLQFGHSVVDFTPEARHYLHTRQRPGSGCPAHQALTGISGKPTFLRFIWSDIVDVLLPPHAKAVRSPARAKGRQH